MSRRSRLFVSTQVKDWGQSPLTRVPNTVLVPTITGGTLTSDATYYYRTFTASDSISISGTSLVSGEVLAVGGGGGSSNTESGGGGGGGVRNFVSAGTVTPNTYAVTVGAGGSAGASGSSSSALSIEAAGGGKGGEGGSSSNGGSGGGSRTSGQGLGNTPTTSPSRGNNGGTGTFSPPNYSWGGGGGAGGVGGNGSGTTGGTGGVGVTITAVINDVVGPGGAGVGLATSTWNGRSGPTNGGSSGTSPTNGATNRGGGAGAPGGVSGRSGGSGVVIVRYLKSEVD